MRRWIASIHSFVRGTPIRASEKVALRHIVTMRGKRIPSLRQWRELPRLLSRKESQVAKFVLVLAACSGIALGAHLWLAQRSILPAIGGSYTEGAVGAPQYINPLYAIGSDVDADLTKLVYSGLFRYDDTRGIIPDLAENFTLSEDQKTYTVNLRKDVMWHDGTPFTARDVLFTVSAIQNPEYHSPLIVSFSDITVSTPTEHTILFTLQDPFSPFLAALTVGILPAHLWEEIPPQNAFLASFNLKPIGTGPYVFSKLLKDTHGTLRSITLTRNAHFYRGTVYIRDITFKFYNNLSELTEAVRNKNVEGASVLAAQDAHALVRDGVINLGQPNLLQYTGIFFNQKKNDILAVDAVRQALALATNRQDIVQLGVGEYATPLASPLLPNVPPETFETQPIPATDLTAAQNLLETEQWTFAEGATVRSKNSSPMTLSITFLESSDLLATAQAVKQQWEKLGIEITLVPVDAFTFENEVLKNASYDALLVGERYGAYPDLYPFWHSSQIRYPGLNLGSFASRKVDDAIEAARTSVDPAKKQEARDLLLAGFTEEIPAIILYQPRYLYGLSPALHGTTVTNVSTPSDRFAHVEEWYRKTRLW